MEIIRPTITIKEFVKLKSRVYKLAWTSKGKLTNEYVRLYTKNQLLKLCNTGSTEVALRTFLMNEFETGTIIK